MALGTILACASAAPATAQELEKVADGLSNPRGLAFGPGGKLYVAEAGRGGSGACIEGPEGDTSCYGATGAITRVNVRRVADLGAYEQASNPDDGQPTAEVDSNPYSVDATGRKRILVTDAGGNTLLSVKRSGQVRTLAVFPFEMTLAPPFLELPEGTQIPYQPVPTGVVRAPGGAAYVGQLTGFPFPAGAANVFHVEAGGAPTVHASGFTNVVDVGRGRNGVVYVLQITTTGLAGPPSPGRLVRVAADGTQIELAAGDLENPTGLAVAHNGDLYVADRGGSPDDARIVRIAGSN